MSTLTAVSQNMRWIEREFSLSIPPLTAEGTVVSLSLEDIGLRGVQLHVEVRVDPLLED
jgi:hypothetical protein